MYSAVTAWCTSRETTSDDDALAAGVVAGRLVGRHLVLSFAAASAARLVARFAT